MRQFARDMVNYWPLIVRLAKSQIALRYRQSIFGISWAVLQPAAMMIVFTFVLHKGADVPSEGNVPYALFVYCALLPWQLLSSSLTFGVPSLVQFAGVVRKVYVPRETFPLSAIVTSFFDFLLAVPLFVVLMVVYHESIRLNAHALWVLPILLLQIVFTAGVLFFGSALCVKYRDIRHGVAFGAYMWMFASPVMVSLGDLMSKVPEGYGFVKILYVILNPMATYLDGYRKALLHGQSPDLLPLAVGAFVSILLFVAGYRYFKSREMGFADII